MKALSPYDAWMSRCLTLAREAHERGDAPVGCVIVRGGQVIAAASERVRTAVDPTAHAELLAVRQACRALGRADLSGCELYTNVEPCWMCSYAIREARIGSVVIGVAVEDVGGVTGCYPILTDSAVTSWGTPPRVLWGVLAEECRAVHLRDEPR